MVHSNTKKYAYRSRQLLVGWSIVAIVAILGGVFWYKYQSTHTSSKSGILSSQVVPSPNDIARIQTHAALGKIHPVLNTIIGLPDRKLSETVCVSLAGSVIYTSSWSQDVGLPIGDISCFVPAKFRESTGNNPEIFSGATLLPIGVVPVDPKLKSDFLKFVDSVNEAVETGKPLTELKKTAASRTLAKNPSYSEQIYIASVSMKIAEFGPYINTLCKTYPVACKATKVNIKWQIVSPNPEKISIKIEGQKDVFTPQKDGSYSIQYRTVPFTRQKVEYSLSGTIIDTFMFSILNDSETFMQHNITQK